MQSKPLAYWMVRHFIVLAIISLTACTKDIQLQNNPRQLRVLTYNIHHGEAMDGRFDYQRLAKVITDCNPMNVLLAEHWIDATAPQSRIDYILIRNSDPWRIIEVKIIDERVVSDHRPVLVELEWLGEK